MSNDPFESAAERAKEIIPDGYIVTDVYTIFRAQSITDTGYEFHGSASSEGTPHVVSVGMLHMAVNDCINNTDDE